MYSGYLLHRRNAVVIDAARKETKRETAEKMGR